MRKLLNKPWFVAVMALAAIAFVAHALLQERNGDQYAATDNEDTYAEDAFFEDFDRDADESEPARSGIADIRQALAALNPISREPPANPFDDDSADRYAASETGEPKPEEMAIHLSAVWVQGVRILVLINNRIRIAGDTVGDLTIESATIDGIWVKHPNGRNFVPIGSDFTWVIPVQSQEPNPTLAFNEN